MLHDYLWLCWLVSLAVPRALARPYDNASPALCFQKGLAEGTRQGVEDAEWPQLAAHDASQVTNGAVHRPGSRADVIYERCAGNHRQRRVADERLPHPGPATLLRRCAWARAWHGPASVLLTLFRLILSNCTICVDCRMLPRHHVGEPQAATVCLHSVALHASSSRKLLLRGSLLSATCSV